MGRRRKDAPPIPDDDPRTPLQRNCANARERDRMRVLSKGFSKLKTTLPWVPPDTKLSKLDTLRLATCYIAHLRQILAEDEQNHEDIISGPEHFTELNSDVIDDFTYMDNTKQEYITQFPDNNYVTSQQVNGYSPKIMDGLSGRYAHPMNLTWPYNIAGGRHNGNTASTDSPVTSRSRLDAASNCATQET